MSWPLASGGLHESGSKSTGPTLIMHGKHHRRWWRRAVRLGAALAWSVVAVGVLGMAAVTGMRLADGHLVPVIGFAVSLITGGAGLTLLTPR